MGEIRDRMAADLLMAGLRPKTCKEYLRCARTFVAFHRRPPGELGEEHVRSFILHILVDRRVSRSTHVVYLAALHFLYDVTLQRPEVIAAIPRPKTVRRPEPAVLAAAEVARILDQAPSPFARTLFATAFGCGLRISEACHLQFGDIFGREGVLVVRDGKGGRQRSTLLSEPMYGELRAHFQRYKPPGPWLFPARSAGCPKIGSQWADHPVHKDSVGKWFRTAADNARLRRHVTFHTLRHSFATALQGAGVPLNAIQVLLGHASIATTAHYAHVRAEDMQISSPMDALLG